MRRPVTELDRTMRDLRRAWRRGLPPVAATPGPARLSPLAPGRERVASGTDVLDAIRAADLRNTPGGAA